MKKDIVEFFDSTKFLDILAIYYSVLERRDVKFTYKLDIINDNGILSPKIDIYHVCYIMGDCIKVKATDEEIFTPLKIYMQNKGYDLIDFKYVGGVKQTGYYTDNNEAVFEGINLYLKKIKKKTRRR